MRGIQEQKLTGMQMRPKEALCVVMGFRIGRFCLLVWQDMSQAIKRVYIYMQAVYLLLLAFVGTPRRPSN